LNGGVEKSAFFNGKLAILSWKRKRYGQGYY